MKVSVTIALCLVALSQFVNAIDSSASGSIGGNVPANAPHVDDSTRQRILTAIRGGGGSDNTALSTRTFSRVDAGQNSVKVQTDVKVTSGSGKQANRLNFDFKLVPVPRFRVQLFSKANGTDPSVFAFRTGFLRLAEINDTIGAFQSSNQLTFAAQQQLPWSQPQVSTNTTGSINVKTMLVPCLQQRRQLWQPELYNPCSCYGHCSH
jgi:hypothetical protein